ncbi:hypothetical protein [Humibacter ginsengiterrae]
MLRRLVPVLLIALVAVAGLDTSHAASAAVLVAVASMAVLAGTAVLAAESAGRRPTRLSATRIAWLAATATATPTHTDVRALMHARPPSARP